MAQRPVYIPTEKGAALVEVRTTAFEWCAGLAHSQRQKSMRNLHEAIVADHPEARVLEVSRFSETDLGVALSAFNLTFFNRGGTHEISVESAFQASKVFERGGPYLDLMEASPMEAKKDPRLKSSGHLLRFELSGQVWGLMPATAFYDWIYLNALHRQPKMVAALSAYDAFTDIAFNPEKSVNCQANSVALYLALQWRGQVEQALSSKAAFLELLSGDHGQGVRASTDPQSSLF